MAARPEPSSSTAPAEQSSAARANTRAGLGNVELYLATRRYFGWYTWNMLGLDARDVALQFGHQDGGELVRKVGTGTLTRRSPVNASVRRSGRAPSKPVPLVASRL